MTLQTTLVSLSDATGVAVPGYTTWPPSVLTYEAAIAKIMPTTMQSYFSPGRRIVQSSGNIKERDACLDTRIWAAQSAITLAQAGGTLGNLPRAVISSGDGFFADLSAALTDYTFAMVVRTTSVVGIKALFNVGTTAGTRIYAYMTADDIALQHGTGDIKTSTGTTIIANAWLPLIFSYKNSDKSLRVYANGSITPIISATMTNSPPSDVVAAIGSLRAGGASLTGETALNVVWSTHIHDDATALANLMAALAGIAAL